MLKAKNNNSEIIVNPFENREIMYAFHDIDGTHSLIREWPPVMSICLYDVIVNGLKEDFDSKENVQRLINAAGKTALQETDRFCVESAGLSALTQMEWAIRRAVCEGSIKVNCDMETNRQIIDRIWDGEEIFDDLPETNEMNELLSEKTPRLFKLYETVLNGYCRDRNLSAARKNPDKFIVKGSREFMKYLKKQGVKNFFVTGAVVEKGMGMYEEVETLGYKIGHNELVEDMIGSTWTDKLPKEMIMKKLIKKIDTKCENILVIGDGRAEVLAGVQMGALVISRLPKEAKYQRELHKKLGTNIIISNYDDDRLYEVLSNAYR